MLLNYFKYWKVYLEAVILSTDLSKIRYHFTPCGSTGYDGPTFDQCEEYYNEHTSPIATDRVLFQFDEEDFHGGQGFRIPREDIYNVTIAGAAGGRGLCNILFGHGKVINFQVQLTPDYELLVMVGQKGQSPCDNPPVHSLCHNPPSSLGEANHCNESWYNYTLEGNVNHQIYLYTGGAGGGGASMLRARNVETGELLPQPLVVAGGGGGTSAILSYELFNSENIYKTHINWFRIRNWFNIGRRGFRPLIFSHFSLLSGAGGGWSSLLTASGTDGKSLSQAKHFAEGGLNCDHLQLFESNRFFSNVNGGFGGGGGECGGGGGGGGYTGGAVLNYNNDIPGGGGQSVVLRFENTSITPLVNDSLVLFSINSGDGYVDIVPANCNCSGTCAVNETEDTFECFCPDNTTLAQDGFDCYNDKQEQKLHVC